MAVTTARISTAVATTANVLDAKGSSPSSVSRYPAPTRASAVIAMTVATCTTQPPDSQPAYGPKALVFQTNMAPQSGISRFSSRKAKAVNRIGTKPTISAAGAKCPTTMTTKPSVTAMLYAGATDARPSATTASSPTKSVAKPLPCGSGGDSEVTSVSAGWRDMDAPWLVIFVKSLFNKIVINLSITGQVCSKSRCKESRMKGK